MLKKIKLKHILSIILIIIIIFFICVTKKYWFKICNLTSFIKFIRKHGRYAIPVFLIIFSIKPLALVIPSNMLSIASGILFGPILGFIINMIGFFISGTLAFYLSRFLGKGFVDKLLKGKALDLNNNLENNGFKILFLLRLPPVLPYDPLSYTCGLTKIKYPSFILASLLGVVPETLCYSIMGENILNPFSYKFIIPLIVVLIATLLSGFAFKKSNKIK